MNNVPEEDACNRNTYSTLVQGSVLLVIGFIYNKYQEKIKEVAVNAEIMAKENP